MNNTGKTEQLMFRRISLVLLLMRIGVFMMMAVWGLDKFARPEHAVAVFSTFYGVGGVTQFIPYVIGAIQLAVFTGFLLGYRKRITYGLVLLMHALSTLIAFPLYLNPYVDDPSNPNILFWAAWPVLAACFGLYYLRDLDTRFVVDKS
ncbi:hypothetical protein C1752_03757 [Acaryochloris thomasi RCC1774]|uniref:DoxX protein n=1 Tax=Acaryochloris thomasi RCC1774 TaxID=1764569 RepID=A0A2W1JTB4_9CYAN|nr:hypothetical protein [Acaryochloris thomasi]PZD72171.1 hypothetical protein C1752_03757 [Acaryochloris thomasi RCC1774]